MLKVYIAATHIDCGYFDSVLWLESEHDKFIVDFAESTITRFESLMDSGTKLASILGVELELIYVS